MRNVLLSLALLAATGCNFLIDPDGVVPTRIVASIAVTPTSASLAPGGTRQLTATATYSDGSTSDVTASAAWATAAGTTATVSTAGLVTGVAGGVVDVTASYQGKSASAAITVASVTVTSIAVTPAAATIAPGATRQLTATATYSDSSTGDVTWSATWTTSAAGVATVSAAGVVTAVAAGGATITASFSGRTDTAAITVSSATVSSIAVTPATATVAKGTTQQLTATATYSDSSTGDVTSSATWTTGASGVATVSAGGLVTAVAATGTATITASFAGRSGTATITAGPAAVASIVVTPATSTVPKGRTQQLTATATYTDATTGNVTASAAWSSSAASVVSVDAAGLAKAEAATGSATITASLAGKSGTATVTAAAAVLDSIAVSPSTATIQMGATQQLTATATWSDATTTNVTSSAAWTTSASGVATVSTAGLVTGVSGGPATITASYLTKAATSSITVTTATVTSIAVTPATATVPKGETRQLTATATYSDTSTADVTGQATWTSGATGVATVSSSAPTIGLVTAAATTGTATITASFGGQSGTATITAAPATLVSVAVTPAGTNLPKGATQQLTATATYTDATTSDVTATATWTTSSAAIASVTAGGLAKAEAASGTATITANFGGKAGTATITATPAAVSSIAVTPATASVPKGATQQLTATATYTDATTSDVTATATWTTSAAGVATVSTSGLVTATAATGTATITATFGGKSGSSTITAVAATVLSIALAPPSTSIAVGEIVNLIATATYTDATTADVTASATWSSSAPGVATVSNTAGSKGRVTAISASATPATITATFGGRSGTSAVTVTPPDVVSIAVTPAAPETGVGGTVQLTATATYTDSSSLDVTALATWTSGATGVATVSDLAGSKGLVTGVSGGSASITASYGGQVGSKLVTVKTIASIAVTPGTATVPAGTTTQLTATATLTGGGTQDVTSTATWTSGAAGVATVSDAAGTKGLVTAVAQSGTATISAALGGKTGSATVTAAAPLVASIAVTPTPVSLAKGTTQQLTATATYTDATTGNVTQTATWTTANAAVATVTTSGTRGVVTAVDTGGPVNVTASLGGQSGSAAVTVTGPVVTSIAVTPTPVTLPKGATQQLVATATYSDSSTQIVTASATWSSSAPATVSVTAGGLAKAEATSGSATVTASYGGQSGTATITAAAAALVSIAVTPAPLSIPQGAHQQLTATGTYTDGTTQDLTSQATWTSSDSTAATVGNLASNKGAVTTVATGGTTITAAFGGKAGTCAVTVTPAALVSIRIDLRNDMTGGGSGSPYVSPSIPLQSTPVPAIATGVYSTGLTVDLTRVASWSSSDTTVVSVSNAYATRGEVTTLLAGSATLSAAFGGVTGTLAVSVHAPVIIWVAPFPSELGIPIGPSTVGLQAKALLDDWSVIDITTTATWTSSDTTVVTVASGAPDGGKLTGVNPGSAMVTASQGGTSGGTAVFVKSGAVTLQNVAIYPSPLTVVYGEDRSLSAVAQYSDGTFYDVTEVTAWSSDNTGVVTVDWEGRVYPQVPSGAANVTGTFPGWTPVSVPVTVIPGWWFNIDYPPPIPTGMKLRMRAYSMSYSTGQQTDVTDYLTWTSWNAMVADFKFGDPPGVITATSTLDSSTTIQAQVPGGGQGTSWVQVTALPPSSLAVTPATLTAPVGGKASLAANLTYPTMGTYGASNYATWTSSNPAVVQVDAWGNITAVGAGTATVTASIFGLSASTSVTVDGRVIQSIAITPASLTVVSGLTGQLTATASLQGGGSLDVTRFVSWNVISATVGTGLAAIGSDGTVYGNIPGTGQVVAVWDGLDATASLEVKASPLRSIWLNASGSWAYSGSTVKLTAYADWGPFVSPEDATESAVWTVDNPAAATISNAPGSKGLLTGGNVAAQTNVTVTATYGGMTSSYVVNVYPGSIAGIRLSVVPPFDLKVGQQYYLGLYGDVVPPCLAGPCYVDLTSQAQWSSSNPAIAGVDDRPGSKGLVTAYRRDVGSTTTITASYGPYAPASILLTVFDPVLTALAIHNLDPWFDPAWGSPCGMSSWSWTLPSIFDVRYAACASYDNGRVVDVTKGAVWSTNAPAIATASSAPGKEGLVSTYAPGPVTVQASFGGQTGAEALTVNAGTLSRLINDGGILIAHLGVSGGGWGPNVIRGRALYTDGSEYQVSRYLSAVSRAPAIASVGPLVTEPEVGLPVVGLSAGSTVIDAYYRGYTFSAPVNVDTRPFQAAQVFVDAGTGGTGMFWFMTTPQLSTKLPTGMPIRLQLGAFDAIGLPWTASEVATWSSSNPAVATVSNTAGSRGLVTTLAPGYTTIQATVDGVSATFDVEVTAATITSLTLDRAYDVGPTGVVLPRFYAWATYSDGTQYDVRAFATWPDSLYATWTGNPGEYRVVGAGTSVITVSFGGASTTLLLVGF